MRPTTLAATVLALLAVGCGGGDKSGGDGTPVTLRMATMEGQGAPYADGVEEFARQVEDLSGGSLRIEIHWDAADEFLGGFGPGSDQKVAGLVKAGKKLDLALIPARAWDELGVTSLQALQAPFLISTEQLTKDVVQSDLEQDMLAGLDRAGVVGLALVPEGLRHPVGFERPLVTLGDFSGATIRALPSNASSRLLEALGAKPVDLCCDDLTAAVEGGEVTGAESGFAWGGDLPRPGTVTANLTFYPKVNAVVINEDAFGRLSDEQRTVLREAAARAQRHVVEHTPTESARAARYCGIGGRIAFASDADRAAIENAAGPVYAELEQDAGTKALIEKIEAMKDGATTTPVAACGAARPQPADTGPGTAFPEGVYRREVTPEGLIADGMDEITAHKVAGLVTLTIRDGRWHGRAQGISGECGGPYTVQKGRIALRHDVAQCGAPAGTTVMTARWSLADGELRFVDVRVGRPLEWGGKAWTKIG